MAALLHRNNQNNRDHWDRDYPRGYRSLDQFAKIKNAHQIQFPQLGHTALPGSNSCTAGTLPDPRHLPHFADPQPHNGTMNNAINASTA
jgi:hypothetical protein